MKIFILIIGFTLNINVIHNYSQGYTYWENLNLYQKNNYLSTHNVNVLAIKYYKEEFKISDDKETFELLDVLVTGDTALLPFYYYLFNEICSNADGAVSEILGSYCLKIIIDNPNYVINYFTYDAENNKKDRYYYQIYGELIGYEMYFKEKGKSDIDYSFEQFKEYLNNHFKNSTAENKPTLRLLYNCISATSTLSGQAKQGETYLYYEVDKLPVFENNKDGIEKYLRSNSFWPNHFDGEGELIISFVVNVNGRVESAKIIKGLCEECDKKVKQIIQNMKNWEPGEKDGNPVNVRMFLPIKFVLQ